MSKHYKNPRKRALCMAMGLCLASLTAMPVMAQNTTGSVVGRAEPGTQVTITNPQTGYTRTVTADANGNYRLALLPTGNYSLQTSKDGAPVGNAVPITVTLGNATTVNIGSADAKDLETVVVTGSRVINAVDVTSTESATNLTADEITRLPVDRDVTSVALLAPGVNRSAAPFGGRNGISFGGSSVAENAFYVNGLNVTDFYNRNGFSEAPFGFYKEFQVKTGGYSVEFGRTTGGVVNAIVKSGDNEFRYGAELNFEPRAWQSAAKNRYLHGNRYLAASEDNYSQTKLGVYASGPLIRDRLFFFAMYEARSYKPRSTDDEGETFSMGDSNNGFWGGTIDWDITDKNRLSLMAFSNKDDSVSTVYDYDFDDKQRGPFSNEIYSDTGGRNWALTWTSLFTDNFSMKLMYGENNRQAFTRSLNDLECNRVVKAADVPEAGVPLGCSTNSSVFSRDDKRKQGRADFEWSLGDHLLRFGIDREENTSDHEQYYAGPGAYFYNVYAGTSIPNPPGGAFPPGYSGYVRQRRLEVSGSFESINSALYIEDNWSVTDNLVLNLGLRHEAFDNKDSDGRSYIKMDDMIAPRFGFSWDMKGDGTTKLYGNVGRYFLPVANVISIKQAGGFLDERTYFAFDGWEIRERNGLRYAVPKLGPQIGTVDTSQGDGSVGDLRSEVDRDLDPVYQDEAILGFQAAINDKWSWGVRGIYRRLENAIDDMEISATGACGGDGYIGWVMANPGKKVTVWGDTNCDGTADGWVNVDTAREGWAMYQEYDTGNKDDKGRPIYEMRYIGQRGWSKPKRTYKALELQIDRAWDEKWALNAAYTLSWSEGNAEGPVNSDTNFDDTGRTENFDDPWVNLRGYGPLANDHRHQLKLRGTYAFNENWRAGLTLDARSGGPITGFGVGNPFDAQSYHSYYVCVEKCGNIPGVFDDENKPVPYPASERIYAHSSRGGKGRMPWTYEVGASLAYMKSFGKSELQVKLAIFNLLNQQKEVRVDQDLQPSIAGEGEEPGHNEFFGTGLSFQSPRYAQLTVSVDF